MFVLPEPRPTQVRPGHAARCSFITRQQLPGRRSPGDDGASAISLSHRVRRATEERVPSGNALVRSRKHSQTEALALARSKWTLVMMWPGFLGNEVAGKRNDSGPVVMCWNTFKWK